MAIDVSSRREPSVTSMVGGIVNDVQELTKQQLALFKHELIADLRATKSAAISSSIGLVGIVLGGILLCLAVVYLLNWATILPLWACFGLVGLGIFAGGAGMLYASKKQIESVTPLFGESTKELKENVQCLMNPK